MKKINNKIKRKLRNRKKLKSVNHNRFRVSVSKSLNNLSAQIIDDKQKKTLVSASSIEKEIKSKKVKKMNIEYSNIIKSNSSDKKNRAPRPLNMQMNSNKIEKKLKIKLPKLIDEINNYVR